MNGRRNIFTRRYPSRSWYSIKRPRRDARLSWPWLITTRDGIPARRRSPITVVTGPTCVNFVHWRTPLTTTPRRQPCGLKCPTVWSEVSPRHLSTGLMGQACRPTSLFEQRMPSVQCIDGLFPTPHQKGTARRPVPSAQPESTTSE